MALYSGAQSFAPPFSSGRAPREPLFLLEAKARRAPEGVVFQEVGAKALPRAAEYARQPPEMASAEPTVAQSPVPAEPAGPPPGAIEFAERIAAAVGAMRLTTERLAEQVRSDALEVALLVARRIVETELTADIEPLFGMIRSVVRRAGESRRVTIHLCPDDAARVEAAGGPKGLPGIAMAQVDVHADPSLSTGDCVVEADFGVVDGRMDTRMDELRRILAETVAGMDR